MFLSDSGLNLLFRDSTETICFTERSDPGNHYAMRVIVPASNYIVPGNGDGYDKPIAVLVGPAAVSSGDQVAYRMTFHPRVKTFGLSTNAAFNASTGLSVFSGWYARCEGGGVPGLRYNVLPHAPGVPGRRAGLAHARCGCERKGRSRRGRNGLDRQHQRRGRGAKDGRDGRPAAGKRRSWRPLHARSGWR
jgi:hypothetical protein